jgi:hypothetical protein
MANTPPPSEAIAAQQAYDKADAEVRRLIAEMPPGMDVAEGKAVVSDELAGRLAAARAKRMGALFALLDLKRWEGDGGPIAAEAALRKAARAGGDGAPDAA